MRNNNEQKLKELIAECNGKYQGKKYGVPTEIYCPLIPLMSGKNICKYQSDKIIYILKSDGEKNYQTPRYLCLWQKMKIKENNFGASLIQK